MENDARKLPPEAQEAIRLRAVRAVRDYGLSPTEAARLFGVSRRVVYKWLDTVDRQGVAGLRAKRRGRRGRLCLKSFQAATVVRLVTTRYPEQLGLPFYLWGRRAVQGLIAKRYHIHLSVWTIGRYLRHWGFTPQKPLRRAYEQDPEAVRRWLEEQYPAIHRQALQEKAEIHWLDEMGLRSQDQGGRSYGRRGKTPVIPGTGQRFGCNVISTITNQGHLRFMVFTGTFTGKVMIEFLRRLLRQATKKVVLIYDRHPVHRGAAVQGWLRKHAGQIQAEPLPTYSPNRNPGEYLNQDVKGAAKEVRPHDQKEMVRQTRSYLRSTQKQPAIVKKFFDHPDVRYAKDTNG
jgi:transposase